MLTVTTSLVHCTKTSYYITVQVERPTYLSHRLKYYTIHFVTNFLRKLAIQYLCNKSQNKCPSDFCYNYLAAQYTSQCYPQ